MIDTIYADGSVQAKNHDRFFLGMSGLLLLILLVGFSRTLYLRLFFEVPSNPRISALTRRNSYCLVRLARSSGIAGERASR